MSRASAQVRRVCVVTGTRSEFGVLQTVLRAIQRRKRLQLQLVVTGMHLLRQFGYTIDEIRSQGWHIDAEVPMYRRGRDDRLSVAEATGRATSGIAKALHDLHSDVVLVVGDRVEALAGATAALTTGTLIGHIHGGDVATGDNDEAIRHAITKMAHVHFAASRDAHDRIIRMGEDPDRVHFTGAPGLDELRSVRPATRSYIKEHLGLDPSRPYVVVLQHPAGYEVDDEYRHMCQTLEAVRDYQTVIVYPNNDPGHSGIVRAIKHYAARVNHFVTARSLSRHAFASTLVASQALVGNSSAGIIEAGFIATPVVNIGPRQTGRLKNGPLVEDCSYGRDSVRAALRRVLRRRQRMGAVRGEEYGTGRAGVAIARILSIMPITPDMRRKQISY